MSFLNTEGLKHLSSKIKADLDTKLDSSLKGSANGVAELDGSGKVLSSQLPSYVDDVIEGTLATFPKTGETGKIYVDIATNKSYRWSGSKYVEISASLALGETSSTAYRGDRGKEAYEHSQTPHAPATIKGGDYVDVFKEGDELTIGVTSDLFTRIETEYISNVYDVVNQKANQSDVDTALDKKADLSTFDGSYNLGSLAGKTLAEFREAIDAWLADNNITNASAYFNTNNDWVNIWNSGDTTATLPGGGMWFVTVTSRYHDESHTQLCFTRYDNKLVYYGAKYEGNWRPVYKVAFQDEISSVSSELTSQLSNKANKTHTHDPNDLVLGEYTKGGLDPISRGWIGSATSNKSLGLPAESVYVEYSKDGGTSWTEYTSLDGKKLFDESRSAYFCLGGDNTKGSQTTDWQLRVTITSVDRYCSFDSIYHWMTDNGNTVVFDLERSTIGDPGNFTKIISDQPLDGWAGNNIHYFSYGTFCCNANQPYNYGKYRLTYKMTAVDTNYQSAEIIDIRFFGVNIWGTAGASSESLMNMLKTGAPYTFDVANKKVTFPDTVKATTFEGNALTASTASNASRAEYATFTQTDAASGNSDRRIYFASTIATDTKANLVHNDNFTYNPAQGDLKVNKIKGKETDKLVTLDSSGKIPASQLPELPSSDPVSPNSLNNLTSFIIIPAETYNNWDVTIEHPRDDITPEYVYDDQYVKIYFPLEEDGSLGYLKATVGDTSSINNSDSAIRLFYPTLLYDMDAYSVEGCEYYNGFTILSETEIEIKQSYRPISLYVERR